MLRESVNVITEYLHEELADVPEREEVPDTHVAFHVERLDRWLNQSAEQPEPEGHNGWTNYETWLTALWLDNDRNTYDYWRNEASGVFLFECDADDPADKRAEAAGHLARRLKEQVEPAGVLLGGLYLDMLDAAFDAVNWYEIALSLIDAELQ